MTSSTKADKAAVLVAALPFIRKFRGQTMVVKIGGASLDSSELAQRFVQDLVLLRWVRIRVVVVHGGGKQISSMLERLAMKPRFVDGQRVTDAATLEVVEMVLAGTVNKGLVGRIQAEGARAVGLTGKDGGMVEAVHQTSNLGLVGDVVHVDTQLLSTLLDNDFTPVVASLAANTEGQTLNINADPFAAALAVALNATKLVFLSDVPGVKDASGDLIASLTTERAHQLLADGTIAGGMIPKVKFALGAVAAGVAKVHVIDGREPHALLLEVFTDDGVGTELIS